MLSNSLDGIEGTFPDVGILLVGKLLLEGFDGPVRRSGQQLFRIPILENQKCDRRSGHTPPNLLADAESSAGTERYSKKYEVFVREIKGCTHLVGASFSSMGELMKIARLWGAALMSSCALEIHSFAISSSRTLTLFLFSFEAMLAVADVSVTAGML